MIECPPPGIYRDVPAKFYHAWPAVSSSYLALFRNTPAHARYEMLHPSDSKAMRLGTAIHTAILEPADFGKRYMVSPSATKRSKADRELWAKAEETWPGVEFRPEEELTEIEEIAVLVRAHPTVSRLLDTKLRELSIVWVDEETGLTCKARLDAVTRYAGYTWIVDLKTCEDASPSEFSRSIGRYCYHVKAAHYRTGLATLMPAERKFVWVAIEKKPPYGIAVYEVSDGLLAQGEEERYAYLAQWAKAKESDYWPSYPTDISPIDLPRWQQRRADD